MGDARDPLDLLRAAACAREAAGLRRVLRPRTARPDGLIDLASNDYLGLSGNPLVTEAAAAAAIQWGAGATGSRLVTGSTELHARLERALAGFCGAPQALVFSSGYLANLAAVTALAGALSTACDADAPVAGGAASHAASAAGGANTIVAPGTASHPSSPARSANTLVVSDAANHASLVDGCRLARARVEVTAHRDVAAVAAALARRPEPAALVITEAVFSVDGDLAPLASLHLAAREHGALLVIDEAHALGVLGPGGAGATAAAGLAGQPDVVRTVTLSKSLATQGGAVLGSAEVIQTLIDTGRSFIFDTGLAPPCAGAALAALEVLMADPGLGGRTRANARRIAAEAAALGLAACCPAAGVVSVTLGEPEAALEAQRICARHGVLTGCFRPPSVPAGRACLRMAAHATLTERDLAAVSRALAAVRHHVPMPAPAGRRSA